MLAVAMQSISEKICCMPTESQHQVGAEGIPEVGVCAVVVDLGVLCSPLLTDVETQPPALTSPSATCSTHLCSVISCHLDGVSSNSVCHLLNLISFQVPCRFYLGCAQGIHCRWFMVSDSVSHQLLCSGRLKQVPLL